MTEQEQTFVLNTIEKKSVKAISLFQKQALAEFMVDGFPQKDEDWLYWQPSELQSAFEQPIIDPVDVEDDEDADITIVNGLSFSSNLYGRSDIQVYDLDTVIPDYIQLSRRVNTNTLSLLNSATVSNIIFVEIKSSLIEPLIIDLVHKSDIHQGVISPRLFIYTHEAIECSVFIRHLNAVGENVVVNAFVEVFGSQDAQVDITHLHHNDYSHYFVAQYITIEDKGVITSNVISVGGNQLRYDTQVDVKGDDSKANLRGCGILSDSNSLTHFVDMSHFVPNSFGDQVFKNILTDSSISEFCGLVNVMPKSHEVVSNQLNQNLILNDAARAISRPKLIIDADDVQCSHGCTIGQLDDEMIYYCQSRGLSLDDAKQLLVYGFVKEIVDDIKDEFVRETVLSTLKPKIKTLLANGS